MEKQEMYLSTIPKYENTLSQVLLDIQIARRKFMPKTLAQSYSSHRKNQLLILISFFHKFSLFQLAKSSQTSSIIWGKINFRKLGRILWEITNLLLRASQVLWWFPLRVNWFRHRPVLDSCSSISSRKTWKKLHRDRQFIKSKVEFNWSFLQFFLNSFFLKEQVHRARFTQSLRWEAQCFQLVKVRRHNSG